MIVEVLLLYVQLHQNSYPVEGAESLEWLFSTSMSYWKTY